MPPLSDEPIHRTHLFMIFIWYLHIQTRNLKANGDITRFIQNDSLWLKGAEVKDNAVYTYLMSKPTRLRRKIWQRMTDDKVRLCRWAIVVQLDNYTLSYFPKMFQEQRRMIFSPFKYHFASIVINLLRVFTWHLGDIEWIVHFLCLLVQLSFIRVEQWTAEVKILSAFNSFYADERDRSLTLNDSLLCLHCAL